MSKWEKLEEIEKILKIPYDFTIALQKENGTLSDFFGQWLRCELLLKNSPFPHTDLANTLIDALEERKTSLFSNIALICSVYLDPRFQKQLNSDQITQAKTTILDTWDKITKMEKASVEDNTSDVIVSIGDVNNDILEKFLSSSIQDIESIDNSQQNIEFILEEITRFEGEKRLPSNYSVLKFWEKNKEKYPFLFKIAQVILGVPPTQVPVERSFSTLALIYNCRRVQLSQKMLENIILVKLNKDIAYAIFENDLKDIKEE